MHFVYILYSEKIDSFYVGQTFDVPSRIDKHNQGYYKHKFTARGVPWTLFLSIPCQNKAQALLIEKHIKRMKSKAYIRNLIKYPEIIQKLFSV